MTRKLLVKTLLDRAKTIPTNSALQAQETKNGVETLKLNGYQKRFIEKVVANNHQTNTNAEYEIRGSTCLPYVNGVSEKVKSILTNAGGLVALKPILTLGNIYPKPKARPSEDRTKSIVYKYKCRDCPFTYIGESKRCWATGWLEHKRGVRKRIFSTIKEHAECTGHNAAKSDAVILEKGVKNYEQRIFLEALHSILSENTANEHTEFPACYSILADKIKRNDRHDK